MQYAGGITMEHLGEQIMTCSGECGNSLVAEHRDELEETGEQLGSGTSC